MISSAPFDIGTLITCTPGVYGGRPCLAGTRFPVLQVAVHWREGMMPEEIAADYSLDLVKVYGGVAYYLANRDAIDAELEENEREYRKAAAADREARAARERASA